jgi:hypothetical protein
MVVKRTSVVLSCNHEMDFYTPAPVAGEDIWCTRCCEYRKVERAIEQYNVKCLYCRFARTFGRDLSKATSSAGKHVTSHQTHKVEVKDGNKLLRLVTAMGDTLFSSDAAPRSMTTDHQAILRDFEARVASLPRRDLRTRRKSRDDHA